MLQAAPEIGGTEVSGGQAAVLDRAGRIVSTAVTAQGSALVRLTRSGRIDTAFGDRGLGAFGPLGKPPVSVRGLAPSANGGVLLGGSGSAGRGIVARLTRFGRVDTSFGSQGFVSLARPYASAASVAERPGGSVLVVGAATKCGQALLGLGPAGRADASFNRGRPLATAGCQGGLLALNGSQAAAWAGSGFLPPAAGLLTLVSGSGRSERAITQRKKGSAVVPQSVHATGGKLLTVATLSGPLPRGGETPPCRGTLLARYRADGQSDATFGKAGRVALTACLQVAAVQPGGQTLLSRTSGRSIRLVRLTDRGAIDRSFGPGGQIAVRPAQPGTYRPAALMPSGSGLLYVTGTVDVPSPRGGMTSRLFAAALARG